MDSCGHRPWSNVFGARNQHDNHHRRATQSSPARIHGLPLNRPALAVGCQHRTLQQSVVRAFAAACNQLATDYAEGRYDLRSEAACKLAVEISRLEFGLPFI